MAMATNSQKEMSEVVNRGYWTNERHVHFLNSIEASFVRSMYRSSHNRRLPSYHPRLDRYLPDSSDSTLDLAKKRHRFRHTTATSETVDESSSGRKKTQRAFDHEDQVVPQLQNRRDDDDYRR